MDLSFLKSVDVYWHLPFMIVVISLVYSAARFDEWGQIFREAFRWGVRMAGFLLAIAIVLFVLATVGSIAALVVGAAIVLGIILFSLAKSK